MILSFTPEYKWLFVGWVFWMYLTNVSGHSTCSLGFLWHMNSFMPSSIKNYLEKKPIKKKKNAYLTRSDFVYYLLNVILVYITEVFILTSVVKALNEEKMKQFIIMNETTFRVDN